MFSFKYNHLGRGMLTYKDQLWPCRTGSVTTKSELVNAILPGIYYFHTKHEIPVESERESMEVDGVAWKTRLYRLVDGVLVPTRLLVHPEGGLGGTDGCIGTIKAAPDLRDLIDELLKVNEIIKLEVSK